MNKKAFTLIELLVVVLIIGILSAIALPQYEKAVHKARLAEAFSRMGPMKEAVEIYLLENGYPYQSSANIMDIYPDLSEGLTRIEDSNFYKSKYITYSAFCGSTEDCGVSARYQNGSVRVNISESRNGEHHGAWVKGSCNYATDLGKSLCQQLVSQGYSLGYDLANP